MTPREDDQTTYQALCAALRAVAIGEDFGGGQWRLTRMDDDLWLLPTGEMGDCAAAAFYAEQYCGYAVCACCGGLTADAPEERCPDCRTAALLLHRGM
jgi:hypothetical protein